MPDDLSTRKTQNRIRKLDPGTSMVEIDHADAERAGLSDTGDPTKQYALVFKSKRSTLKLKPDEAKALYDSNDVAEPFIKVPLFVEFQKSVGIHAICLQRKARVIAGLGIKAVSKENERSWRKIVRAHERGDSVDAEKYERAKSEIASNERDLKVLREWIGTVGRDVPLRELLERAWADLEGFGWMAIEVVRDGNGRISELVHMPAHLVRRTKDRTRFVFLRSATEKTWFKAFGSDIHVNSKTGKVSKGAVNEEDEGNEVLFWYQYSPLDPFYGVPVWYASIAEILGSNEARDFMLTYFMRRAVPTYAVIMSGGDNWNTVIPTIRQFFRKDIAGDHHATLAIQVPEGGQIQFQRVTDDPRWIVLIQQYINSLRDAIISAHGLSPSLIGIIETAHLGAGTGMDQLETFKAMEAKPKQETLENLLNTQFVAVGLKIKSAILKLDELDVFDEQREVAGVSALFVNAQRPVLTLNEARARLRLEPIDEEWADEILVMSMGELTPLSQLEKRKPQDQQGGAGGAMPDEFQDIFDYGADDNAETLTAGDTGDAGAGVDVHAPKPESPGDVQVGVG